MNKKSFILLPLLAVSLACSLVTAPVSETPAAQNQPVEAATQPPVQPEAQTAVPVSGDSDTPIPLGWNSSAAYKGLSLALQENSAPTVTPVDGLIGVVCVGMSNAFQECGDFIEKIEAGAFDGQINPQVRFVNCAVPGRAIEFWNDPQYDRKLWQACLERKVPEAGLRPDQIRVLWHKAADMMTLDESGAVYPPYPDPQSDYFRFYQNLTVFAQRASEKIPSLQAVYVSSRSYGGFASKPERGEPLSYEEGLALNEWLKANPSVNGVWYGWGPYLWAPACSAETQTAPCYQLDDYQKDGIHPAAGARDKISALLHERISQFAWYAP